MLIGSFVVGVLTVVFAISYVALVYTGPLAEMRGTAIPLALIGAAVMTVVGAAMHTLPALAQPQDITAIVLAGGAAAIAAGTTVDVAGPTALAFVALSTLSTGVIVYLAGSFHLGRIVRFMPYPVLGGFLAATGYALLAGAIGLALDRTIDIGVLASALGPDTLPRWAPWITLSLAMVVATRVSDSDLVLPISIAVAYAAFLAWLWNSGGDLAGAAIAGLLLGPFPEAGLADLPDLAARIDWPLALSQWPIVLAIVPLTILGALLNMSGLEVSLRQRTDFDADLRAVGASNIATAASGGLVGYPVLGKALLAHRFGLSRLAVTVATVTACLFGAFLGTEFLALLPRGVFATVIGFLGIDLLVRWLYEERAGMAWRDRIIVLLILTVAAVVGFLEAIGVGFVVAGLLFVETYARLDPVHARTTLATHRSVVERPDTETRYLSEAGEAVAVIELTGYLFFGSAHGLYERVRTELAAPGLSEIVLDFSRVQGMDVSAVKALGQIRAACTAAGVRASICALPAEAGPLWRADENSAPGELYERLDQALLVAEERMLSERDDGASDGDGPLARIDAILAGAPEGAARNVLLPAGATLLAEGDANRDFFILRAGEMRAEIAREMELPFVVARYRPGALIGEIAFYGSLPRTASIVADSDAEVLRIDPVLLQAEAPARAAELHGAIASHLARRLARTTRLLRQVAG